MGKFRESIRDPQESLMIKHEGTQDCVFLCFLLHMFSSLF